jgi:acetyl-CoA carboxylase biotin carboxyl carrier protein
MRKSPRQLREIAGWMAASGLELLVLRTPDEVIRLGRGGVPLEAGQAPVPRPASARPRGVETLAVRSASVGVFLLRHPARAQPLAEVGQRVTAGEALGLLRIGPLLLPVAAPTDGRVVRVHAADASPVGFGVLLFDFHPHSS